MSWERAEEHDVHVARLEKRIPKLRAELAAARAEAGRLRGALQGIVDFEPVPNSPDYKGPYEQIAIYSKWAARAALAAPADAAREPILITRIAFPESNYRPTNEASRPGPTTEAERIQREAYAAEENPT